MTEGERRLSSEEARRLWKRAAELQAEASARLEKETRELATPGEGEVNAGYALDEVRDAASDAGIAPEFVELAIAESDNAEEPGSSRSRLASWLAGHGPKSLVVSRRFDYPLSTVRDAVLRVFPKHA